MAFKPTHPTFRQISFDMTIPKKKGRMQSTLVKKIIDLERLLVRVLEKGEDVAIKCHNTPVDNDFGYYEINLPYFE